MTTQAYLKQKINKMTKTYVFDTSVLIADPLSITAFPNNDIVIPIAVLDEIDKLKKMPNITGKNARVFMRLLDGISELGDISVGVMTDNGSVVKVDTITYPNDFGNALYGDTRILACAYHVNKDKKGNVVLVSNDINLRVRGRAAGLMCEKYEKNQASLSDLYTGVKEIVNIEAGIKLAENGTIIAENYDIKCYPNECVIFLDEEGKELSKGKFLKKGKIKSVSKSYPWGLSPRNSEQELAIDVIMDNKIPLVSLVGSAGCGKTIVSLAAALELVLNKKAFDRLIIYRPIQAVGNDIGYLPGSYSEKLEPYFGAIIDNFEVLFTDENGKWKQNFEMYKKKDKIQFEAITYIRGRSIPNSLILLDECQNISKEDIKTVLTRVGEGSKILLSGDIGQIDAQSLDIGNNGLTYAIEKFKSSDNAAHITFKHGQRSKLATEASLLL